MQVGKCGSNLRITENEHTYVYIIPIVCLIVGIFFLNLNCCGKSRSLKLLETCFHLL